MRRTPLPSTSLFCKGLLYDVKKDWFYDDILVFGKTKIQKPILLNRERVVTVEVFLRLRYH
ncbi:hypothetical protein CBG53_03560 [Porphyromonas gingivalis]|nr:hypothetical protein CBG53_03560 [Porphyromonas gingivalis]